MDVVNVREKLLMWKPVAFLFTIIPVICGLDFGYVKLWSTVRGIFIKLIAIASALTITVFLSRPIFDFNVGFFFYVLYSAEYLTYTSILFFSGYTLYEFFLEFEKTATILDNRHIFLNVVKKSYLLPFIFLLIKIVVSLINCSIYSCKPQHDEKLGLYVFIMIVSNFAFDSLLLVQFLIMYTYYRHMKVLKLKVVNHYILVSDILKVYRNIMGAVHKIKPVCDKLIMTCVIMTVPRLMATGYMVLHQLKLNESTDQDWLRLAQQCAIVLEWGVLMCAPALAAEAANDQFDDMLLTLRNDLIDTTDAQKRIEIEEALRYISARPSQYYVWRRIPVDARLPMAIISIMIIYLIILIQFTHFFD